MRALVSGGKVAAVAASGELVDVPVDMPVEAGWDFDGAAFVAPPVAAPWRVEEYRGFQVEVFEVGDSRYPAGTFPAGVNVTFHDDGKVSVETPAGWEYVVTGDRIVRSKRDADAATKQALGVTSAQVLAVPARQGRVR